jgi:RNA polymerase sigma-70 factor (sigma-E family)
MRLDNELAAFCETQRPRLVGLLALYVGDRHVAEELSQEALIRLCQHWPRVRSMNQPRAWLDRVAFNLARSWFRRRSAARRALERHGPDRGTAPERDDATVMVVRAAVRRLPPRMRQAVVCRHFLGLSVRETAQVMGCAEGTVKSLTAKALTALRDSGIDETSADRGGSTVMTQGLAATSRERQP